MADHQFEQKVSRQLADFKLKPSAEVWQHVEAQLKEDKKRRRWFFLLLPVAVLLIGGITYCLWPSGKEGDDKIAGTTNVEAPGNTTTLHSRAALTKSNQLKKEQSEVEPGKNEVIAQPPAAEVENGNDGLVEANRPKKNRTGSAGRQKNNETGKNRASGFAEVKEAVTVVISEQQNRTDLKQEEKPVVSTVSERKTPAGNQDTVINTKQLFATDSSNAGKLPADTAIVKPNTAKSAVAKKKWQLGLQVNAGIADIRETLFPGSGFRAESLNYVGNNGSPSTGGGPSRIVIYDYAIKPSLQFGTGIVVRKPFKRRHAFVTGLQYQYNSYHVVQRQRIDSFVQTSNSFSTISTREKKTSFRTHAINIPLEFEFQIANAGKGSIRLSAGIHQSFAFASVQKDTLSTFRYAAANTLYSPVNETKATVYQPMLHLAPLYEVSGKKHTSQVGFYFNYGLRPVYQAAAKDYWWQTGLQYRIYFKR